MSIRSLAWCLLIGSLFALCGLSLTPASVVAQSAQSRSPSSFPTAPDAREAPSRPSSSDGLPAWAEPSANDRPSDLPDRSRTKGNPGFPGDDPEQEVPVGGGSGAVLLAAAGAAYGIRRLRNSDDTDRH